MMGKPEKKEYNTKTGKYKFFGTNAKLYYDQGANDMWEEFEAYLKTRELSEEKIRECFTIAENKVLESQKSDDGSGQYVKDFDDELIKAIVDKFSKPEGDEGKIRDLTKYPEEPNPANMNEELVWDYKERLDAIATELGGIDE